MSRLFSILRRRDDTEDLYESYVVADEIGQMADLPLDHTITFVHTKWWRFGKRLSADALIPFRPIRSDTLQTVGHLVRAIKKEYRDLGFTAQVVGPDGLVSGRMRLRRIR